MSLKINKSIGRIISWVAWSLLGLFFLIFFIRVAVWEANYYNEKEGSERDVIKTASLEQPDVQELEEEVPTEEEVREYTVAPERPRYLTIAKLGIRNARILAVGVNENSELGTPNNIFDVGWYEGSEAPGEGGTVLIDGHNGGPHVHGVFKDLPSLSKGDFIEIERGDGLIFRYSVVENNTVSLEDSNAYMATALKSPEAGRESVTLITCTGEWSDERKTYLSRQFTRAVLLTDD